METILGLIMIYTWVHSVVIIAKRIQSPTTYETSVMILAMVLLILFVIGSVA